MAREAFEVTLNLVIGQDTIDQVRSRTSLVELVGEAMKLERRGRSHVGLCPFHQEKTPSFHVSAERNFYHCFGCGRSGDAIRFIEETEGLTFVEAVRRLAERAGIVLVETRDAPDRAQAERARRHQQQLFDLLQVAAAFYQRCLKEHPLRDAAEAELLRRGLDPRTKPVQETCEAFRIGYAPSGWESLCQHLKQLELSLGDAEALGLIVPRKQGSGYYDRFRHRLMFAVTDLMGRVVAFSGRALPLPSPSEPDKPGYEPGHVKQEEAPAKYLNSPESALYRKREVVFGLYQARQAIRAQQNCIVVEGNFDVVSLHARGVAHVVAPLGTAFTAEQAKQIRRFSPTATLMFDGDSAGKRAVHAARDACKGAQLRARVATLPQGTDPDEIARRSGREGIARAVETAQGMLEYLIDTALDAEFAANDLSSRVARIREVTDLLASEDDPAVRALAQQHADRIASRLGITDARSFQALARSVRAALSGAASQSRPEQDRTERAKLAAPARARSRDQRDEIGRAVFGSLLDYPTLLRAPLVVQGLQSLEGDAARAVAALGRDPTLEDLDAFFALLPNLLLDFARARLAAPLHDQEDAAKTEVLENLRKLKGLDFARRRIDAVEELERVQSAGDFDNEMLLLEAQAQRARERLGL